MRILRQPETRHRHSRVAEEYLFRIPCVQDTTTVTVQASSSVVRPNNVAESEPHGPAIPPSSFLGLSQETTSSGFDSVDPNSPELFKQASRSDGHGTSRSRESPRAQCTERHVCPAHSNPIFLMPTRRQTKHLPDRNRSSRPDSTRSSHSCPRRPTQTIWCRRVPAPRTQRESTDRAGARHRYDTWHSVIVRRVQADAGEQRSRC